MGFLDRFKKKIVVDKSEHDEFKKGFEDLQVISNYLRPENSDYFFDFDRNKLGGLDNKVTTRELVELSLYSDILINILNTLKNEMFRTGFDVTNKNNFEIDLELEKIEKVIRKANFNYQTLIEVFKEIENDLNVNDDAYLFARKNYFVNTYNKIIGGEVEEFLRIDPASCEMMFDKTSRLGYNKEGQRIFFDPEKRGEVTKEEFNADGRKNFNAAFRVRSSNTSSKDSYLYYDTNEIMHVSKYRPTKTYGFSPLFSLYNKTITLINMDYYIKQYYSGDKVPKGMLTVNTSNATSFMKWWDAFIQKVRKNPHAVNPVIHQSTATDPIKWIDFMRNLKEMQYTEVRNEIRTQMGAVYNVSPIFQNDVSTGGGLNNEGLQITVTDRGSEMGKEIYNSKLLPWMSDQMGITSYDWKLNPSKEIDQVHEKDLRLKDLEIAQKTAELGIVTTMNETGEFSYKEGQVELQDTGSDVEFSAGMTKADKPSNSEMKDVENALANELDKLLKKFDTKTRPTKEQLDKKIKETVKDFDKIVKSKSSNKLKAIYRKAAQDLGKKLGESFSMTDVDKNVLEALKKQPHYQKSFENMSSELSNSLLLAVDKAYENPKGFSIDNLMKEMRKTTDDTDFRLRRIARTSTTKVSVAARKIQYDKTGATYLWDHIGPADVRTSEMSKEIKKLTKGGVTWEEYVKIIKKVSKKHNPKWVVDSVAPITHPNTRHIPVARRVK